MTGNVPCSARAIRFGVAVLGAVRPPLGGQPLGQRGRRLDLVAHRRRRAAERARLERGDERVADRGARLEAARQRDHRHAVGARALGQRAAGRGHQPRRAGRLGRVVGRERLLGVAGVARAQHERLRRRSRPGRRSPSRAPAGARRRGPSAPAASRPPTDEPPMPATIRPPGASSGAIAAESTRQSASRRCVPRSSVSPNWPVASTARAGARASSARHQNRSPPSGIVTPGKSARRW